MKLTIVSASYNALSTFGLEKIESCIRSVASLPVEHEHLIYDGKSTDGTVDVLNQLAAEISSLKVISEKDTGIYEALNKGLRDAQGDYFYVLGLDDEIIDCKAFCACLNKAINGAYDILIAQVKFTYNGKNDYLAPKTHINIYDEVFCHAVCHQGVLMRTDIAKRYPFDITYRIAADVKQQLLMHLGGARVGWMGVAIARFGDRGVSSTYRLCTDQEVFSIIKEVYALNEKEYENFLSIQYVPFRIVRRLICSGSWFSFVVGCRAFIIQFWRMFVLRKVKDDLYSTYYLFSMPIYRHIKKSVLRNKVQSQFTSNNEEVTIVCASDDNYAPFMAIMMRSVVMHTNAKVKFYVLDGGISATSKYMVDQDLCSYLNAQIEYVSMKGYALERFPDVAHYSLNTFSRYFIPEILPRNVKKVIYLDVDTVVVGDILELYHQNMCAHPIAAVLEDFYEENYSMLKNEIYPEYKGGDRYFNAGVLLMDVEELRKLDFTKKAVDLTITLKDKLHCPDQDVLNIMFDGNFTKLDYKFNYMPDHFNMLQAKHPNIRIISPLIIHYTAAKPWKEKGGNMVEIFHFLLRSSNFYKLVKTRYPYRRRMGTVKIKLGPIPLFRRTCRPDRYEIRILGIPIIRDIRGHAPKRSIK